MTEKIILASASPFRKAMLENAGVQVEAVPAELDERAVEAPLQDIADELLAAHATGADDALIFIGRFTGATGT